MTMPEKPTYEELERRIQKFEKAEKEFQRREERYKLAIEATEDGIWDFDPRTGVAYFSPRWLSMLGYKPGELEFTYETWTERLHPDDRPDAEAALRRFLDQPEDIFSIEFRMRTKNGDWRWIHSRGKAFERDSAGRISRMIGTHVDITERRRLENALLITQFSFDKASIGIYWISAEAQILNVNEQAARQLGYSIEELKSMSILDIDPLVNNDNWGLIWQKLYENGSDKFETIHRRKDGVEVPVYITSNLLDYGGRQFSIAFSQDITDRKKMEKDAKRLEEALNQSQKMEAIGTLAGGIAHDFNNILSAVIGYSELSIAKTEVDSPVHQNLQKVITAGLRARDLVQQILAFSRKEDRIRQPVNFAPVVKEALKLMRASLPTTIEISQYIDDGLELVLANPIQIHQIVMNLCANAAQAMAASGGRLCVRTSQVRLSDRDIRIHPDLKPGDYLKLSVQDTGHGIAPEIMQRIYDPFFTTKPEGKGTGLGLSVVHGIVKSYNGVIIGYSEPDCGTRFDVYIPTVKEQSVAVKPVDPELPRGSEHILLVDDEPALLETGRQLLENFGYRVSTAGGSEQALGIFRRIPQEIDLVLTDMTMPHMTGDKLAVELLKIRPDLSIVLCTGYSIDMSDEKAEKMGIKSFLHKPILEADLSRVVRNVLDSGKGVIKEYNRLN